MQGLFDGVHGALDLAFHGFHGHTVLARDVGLGLAIQPVGQEHGAAARWQGGQGLVHGGNRFAQAMGVGDVTLGLLRPEDRVPQGIALALVAPEMVDHQVLGHGIQVGARRLGVQVLRQLRVALGHAQPGVVHHVVRILAVAQLARDKTHQRTVIGDRCGQRGRAGHGQGARKKWKTDSRE